MRPTSRRFGLLAPLLLGAMLVSCGESLEPAEFVFLLGTEPETIDPAQLSGQPGGRVALNIFEGLTYRHPQTLEPMPGVASSWDLSEDGRTWTFHLRPEAVWSDGTPVTAHDFVYAWTRTLTPATAAKYANMLFMVEGAEAFNGGETDDPSTLGMEAVDDHTFRVHLTDPCAYFLDLCAFYPLLPQPRWAIEKHGEDWIKPGNIVSNGPFVLEAWMLSRSIRLRKNPLYWGAADVQLETAEGITSDNINANFNLYMSGIMDWADASAVPLFVIPELKERADFHVAPYFCTYFYRFNVTRPPFDDARVRRALFLAMDRNAITTYVMRAGQEPAHSLVPPGIPGYDEIRLPERNVEEARRLLAEAGYPGGEGFPTAELLFNTSESHKQIAEVIQQQWKEALGIDITLVNQEWKVFLATTQQVDYWISRGSWIGDYLDPNTFLDLWMTDNGNNRTGFSDPEYDRILKQAATTVDPAARMALLREAEEYAIADQMVVLPVYYYVVMNLYDTRDFGGLQPNLVNTIDLKSVVPLRGHRGHPRDRHFPREGAGVATR